MAAARNEGVFLRNAELRFVLLRHSGMGATHFDLLVQVPGREKLFAWRLAAEPWEKEAAKAERNADHRAIYMTYEGPISEGRGVVERVAAGLAIVMEEGAGEVRLRLEGERVCEIVLPLAVEV